MSDAALAGAGAATRVSLASGTLVVEPEAGELGLGELCGYASRRSRKRGFVFVSKVLGKHHPVRPGRMAEIHARLAAKLEGVAKPFVVIGLAETATGLAQGVYEQLVARVGCEDTLFIHSTRYRLDRPPALCFSESHSHATEHLLYEPVEPEAARVFREARSLVLVDDEVTTGRTLAHLARGYHRRHAGLGEVHLVCLTEWLGDEGRAVLAEGIGLPTRFHCLLRGRFRFTDRPGFDPGEIPDVTGRGDPKHALFARDFGRLGVRGPLELDLEAAIRGAGSRPGERLLVLGTGEFIHAPFRLALELERRGADVHFQSTTRSPLLVGDDLGSVIGTVDNYHDGIPNYLYNVADRRYDRVVLCYETRPLPQAHRLPQALGAATVFF